MPLRGFLCLCLRQHDAAGVVRAVRQYDSGVAFLHGVHRVDDCPAHARAVRVVLRAGAAGQQLPQRRLLVIGQADAAAAGED